MKNAGKKGVTLIELIMMIVVVGILAAVGSMYIKVTIDLWQFLNFRNEVASQARMALIRIEREIRQTRDSDSVLTADATRFRFIDMNNITINYCRATANCTCNSAGTYLCRDTSILMPGLTNFIFTYYDSSNQVIASPSVSPDKTDIKCIKITFTIQSGNQTKTLSTKVYPRNL